MASQKRKLSLLAFKQTKGISKRIVYLLNEYAKPTNSEKPTVIEEVQSRFLSLNRKIEETILEYIGRFNETQFYPIIHFAKEDDPISPDNRNASFYLSVSTSQHESYRAMVDFVGGANGVRFHSTDGSDLSAKLSHIVGIVEAHLLEIHGSNGFADAIIYAKLTKEVLFHILHDIAVDIYFFHHYFDHLLISGEFTTEPSIATLRAFSVSKVQFAAQRGLAVYGVRVTDFKNANKVRYVSFAACCRSSLSDNTIDYKRYHDLWLAFLRRFNGELSINLGDASWPRTTEDIADRFVTQIISLQGVGGQLSKDKLRRGLIAFMRGAARERANNPSTIVLVTSAARPSNAEKRNRIASFLKKSKWRRNMWRFFYDPPEATLATLMPYVHIFKLNSP